MNINQELTIIIKTFEREKSLKKMLVSMVDNGIVNYQILILDDSKVNYKDKILKEFKNKLNIEYIITDFDIGVSAGRNILLNKVKTPYFLLCDDDYIFDKRVKLEKNLKILKDNKADIVGGVVYNRYTINNLYELFNSILHPKLLYKILSKKEIISDYIGDLEIQGKTLYLKREKKKTMIIKTDIVNNFFIAKTESIKKIGGWINEIKTAEHEELFLRAKLNKLNVFFSRDFGVKHYPIRTYKYSKYRKSRAKYFGDKWLEKYNLENMEIRN